MFLLLINCRPISNLYFKHCTYIQSLIHNYIIRKNTLISQCGHDHMHIHKLIKFHSHTVHYNMYIIVLTLAPLETKNCTTAE